MKNQCKSLNGSKFMYNTQDEAIAAAKIINSKPSQIHKVKAYKCNHCKKYHIGKGKKLLEHNINIYKNE